MGRKVYIIGLAHTGTPFSRFMHREKILKKVKTINLEKGYKERAKPIYERFFKYSQGSVPKVFKPADFYEDLANFIYNTKKKIRLEEGVSNKEYWKYRGSWARLMEIRTRRDVRQILKDFRKGSVLMIRGYGHIPFLVEELMKRGIRPEVYAAGGLPAFLPGTPLMKNISWEEARARTETEKLRIEFIRLGHELLLPNVFSDRRLEKYSKHYPTFLSMLTTFIAEKSLRELSKKWDLKKVSVDPNLKYKFGREYFETLEKNKEWVIDMMKKRKIILVNV